jgi:chromosome segregation ATPase
MFHSAKLAKAEQDAKDALARAEAAENELAALKAQIADAAAQANQAAMPEDEGAPKGEDKPEGSEDEDQMEPEAHLASISASVATLTAKIGELEQAQAGMDKAIEAKVSATFAAMGIDPIARAPGGADGTKDGNTAASLKGVKRLAAASAPKTA